MGVRLMSIAEATRTGFKAELQLLAIEYQALKDIDAERETVLTKIISLLEPMIRGKVLSAIYKYEKSWKRHESEFQDLCQECRIFVQTSLDRLVIKKGKKKGDFFWNQKKGTFYTFMNLVLESALKSSMYAKHKSNSRMVCDYSASLDSFMDEEVGEMRLSDRLIGSDGNQDKLVGAIELGDLVSAALKKELAGKDLSKRIFKLLLAGNRPPTIARQLKKRESLVRFKIKKVVDRVKKRVVSNCKDLYLELDPDFTKLVVIKVA